MSAPAAAIVVTGASTGIGEACVRRLDAGGHRVFAGVRKEADGERLRETASDRLCPVILDVVDTDSIRAAATQIDEALESPADPPRGPPWRRRRRA